MLNKAITYLLIPHWLALIFGTSMSHHSMSYLMRVQCEGRVTFQNSSFALSVRSFDRWPSRSNSILSSTIWFLPKTDLSPPIARYYNMFVPSLPSRPLLSRQPPLLSSSSLQLPSRQPIPLPALTGRLQSYNIIITPTLPHWPPKLVTLLWPVPGSP